MLKCSCTSLFTTVFIPTRAKERSLPVTMLPESGIALKRSIDFENANLSFNEII